MKTILKILGTIFIVAILVLGGIILYATITDYNPPEKTQIYSNQEAKIPNDSIFNIMTWNIGYCGMSKEMDFFYDGGTQTRVSKKTTLKNIENIMNFVEQQKDTIDFLLLQEVDTNAKRSYHTNQLQELRNRFKGFHIFFATNYDVFFVPVPVSKPYGKIKAGLVSLSRYTPTEVTRFQFPGNYAWPKNLFMLDRCFLEMRFKLDNGKELLVINTHNSAFDDGSLKKKQMEYLKKHLTDEYNKGNYVIVGGDWNQTPPDYKPQFTGFVTDTSHISVPSNYIENWKWVYDPTVPTNRNSNVVWDKKNTPVKIIDFYLISPNIDVIKIKGVDLNFENTDHQPVFMKIKLRK